MEKHMLSPLFVGLPGAGKTTLSRLVGARLGLSILGTDPLFRVFRALPATEKTDARAEVMRRFLGRAKELYPACSAALDADAVSLDAKGRCALHDSARFRAYGEDVFRLFEIEMLRWLDETDAFSGKIVDLSASAPLYDENRKLFTPENGYLPILVATDPARIADNLVKDYILYRAQSAAAGEKKPIRGAYEKAMDEALGALAPDAPGAHAILLAVACEMTAKESQRRFARYEAFTQGRKIVPEGEDSLSALTDDVVAMTGR